MLAVTVQNSVCEVLTCGYAVPMVDSNSGVSDFTQAEAEWLSLLRYQLLVAVEQSKMPPPLNALAINSLHDAVDGLLSLAAEHLKADLKKRADFIQLFDAVIDRLQDSSGLVGFRKALESMNTARVNFKHHGNSPSEPTIRRHVDRASEFMEELTPTVFGRRLDSVSLLQFIRIDEVRLHLEQSRVRWASADANDAMEELRLGFDLLVKDFERRKVWSPGSSLFDTRPSFAPTRLDFQGLGHPFEKMFEWLENIDKSVRNLAIGVDMRRYAYFDAHAPRISYYVNGGHRARARDDVTISGSVFERCFKFVVDTALSFAADDFDFDPWSARRSSDAGV